jgi:hypothetical protein
LACDTRLLGVQVFSPYRANFKPPLEVVVMTFKYLLDVISDLHSLADNLQTLVDTRETNESEVTHQPEPLLDTPVKPNVTLEQVRAVLADKSRLGKTAEVRALLQQFGAEKLSEINPDKYPDLIKASEEL